MRGPSRDGDAGPDDFAGQCPECGLDPGECQHAEVDRLRAEPTEPPDDPSEDEMLDEIDRLNGYVDRLRAKLVRLRGERDRLFDTVVFSDQGEFDSRGRPIDRPRAESIKRALVWMVAEPGPDRDVAAALAEHDRRANAVAARDA